MLIEASGSINEIGNTYGEVPYLSYLRPSQTPQHLKLTESSIIGSISASSTPAVQFQGWLTNVHVPSSCLPYAGAGSSDSGSRLPPTFGGVVSSAAASTPDDFFLDGGGVIDSLASAPSSSSGVNNEIPPIISSRCFHEGRLFDYASAWTAEHDRCMLCSCQRGRHSFVPHCPSPAPHQRPDRSTTGRLLSFLSTL